MMPALVPARGTIKRWFKNARGWRLQRRQRSLVRWELERAKGKTSFVIRSALIYSLIMTAVQDFFMDSFADEDRLYRFLFNAIFYSIGGVFLGFVGWSSREKDYKNALREIRVATIAAGASPPDNPE